MTIPEAVDGVLDAIEFTSPVELADVHVVHLKIRQRLPDDAKLETYHRVRDVVVEVRVAGAVVCRRVRPVVDAAGG